MSEENKSKKSSKVRRIVAIVIGVFVLAFGAAMLASWLIVGDRIPEKTTAAGIEIGGLSSDKAIAKIKAEIAKREAAGINITAEKSDNNKSANIKPSAAGLSVDYQATVEQAIGSPWNPTDVWRALTGGGPVGLVAKVDDNALKDAVTDLAPKMASAAKSATVKYQGTKVVLEPGVDEGKLDIDATAAAIKKAWHKLPTDVPATMVYEPPPVTTEQAEEIVKKYAEPAVSAPVTMVTKKGKLVFTPEMIAAATTFDVKDKKIVPATSAEKLLAAIKPAVDKFNLPEAKDAYFTFSGGRPTIVDSVSGLSIDAKTIEEKALPLITVKGDRKVEINFVKTKPKFTTEDAKKLGIKEVVAQFTTYFPDTAYRNNNLPRATRALNGTVVKPGETFSFNQIVGQRTAARGYMAGGAICGGNRLCKQLGGGVSQVATTTYNAFFFSGLKHITHQPHTLYFSRYPAGREATIDWGHIDVSFYNDSDYGVYIQGIGIPGNRGNSGTVTIKIWSTKVYDVRSSELAKSNFTHWRTVHSKAADCKPQGGKGGFDVNYRRLWYRNGKLVKSEPYFWRYGTADHVICEK